MVDYLNPENAPKTTETKSGTFVENPIHLEPAKEQESMLTAQDKENAEKAAEKLAPKDGLVVTPIDEAYEKKAQEFEAQKLADKVVKDGESKEGFFSKMMEGIKKFFKSIGNMFKGLFGMFGGKKDDKEASTVQKATASAQKENVNSNEKSKENENVKDAPEKQTIQGTEQAQSKGLKAFIESNSQGKVSPAQQLQNDFAPAKGFDAGR